MIVQWFSDMFYKIMTGLLSWVNLPHLPDNVLNYIEYYFALIMDNGLAILTFFMPMGFVKILIPLVILLSTFEYLYYIVMWVLKKIPAVGIH